MPSTLCPNKNIPNILHCYLNKDYTNLIIFETNVSDTTEHKMKF